VQAVGVGLEEGARPAHRGEAEAEGQEPAHEEGRALEEVGPHRSEEPAPQHVGDRDPADDGEGHGQAQAKIVSSAVAPE